MQSFTHPHALPNIYDLLCEIEVDILKNCSCFCPYSEREWGPKQHIFKISFDWLRHTGLAQQKGEYKITDFFIFIFYFGQLLSRGKTLRKWYKFKILFYFASIT